MLTESDACKVLLLKPVGNFVSLGNAQLCLKNSCNIVWARGLQFLFFKRKRAHSNISSAHPREPYSLTFFLILYLVLRRILALPNALTIQTLPLHPICLRHLTLVKPWGTAKHNNPRCLFWSRTMCWRLSELSQTLCQVAKYCLEQTVPQRCNGCKLLQDAEFPFSVLLTPFWLWTEA